MNRDQKSLVRKWDYTQGSLKKWDYVRNFFYLYRKKFFLIIFSTGTPISNERFFEEGFLGKEGEDMGAIANTLLLAFTYEKCFNQNMINYSNCVQNNSQKNIFCIIFLDSRFPPIMHHRKRELICLLSKTNFHILSSLHRCFIIFLFIKMFLPIRTVVDEAETGVH